MTQIDVNTDELRRLASRLEQFSKILEETRVINCNGFMALAAGWQGHSRVKVEQMFAAWEQTARHLEEQGYQLANVLEQKATALEQADGSSG